MDGEIDEMGTHDELINNQGVYFALVQSQELVHGNISKYSNGNKNNGHIETGQSGQTALHI